MIIKNACFLLKIITINIKKIMKLIITVASDSQMTALAGDQTMNLHCAPSTLA